MTKSGPITSRIRLQTLALPALVAGLALAACSGDSNDAGGTTGLPASTSYTGVWAASGGTGPISITFATAVQAPQVPHNDIAGASSAPTNATGTLVFGSTTFDLTGSLNGSTLTMSGTVGSVTVTLDGTLSNGIITGTVNDGTNTGNFTAASNTEGQPATSYCGYFSGGAVADPTTITESGYFSVVIVGTFVEGVAFDDGGEDPGIPFSGVAVPGASGGTFKINVSNGAGTLKVDNGTYDAAGIAGAYATSVGGTPNTVGTFDGVAGCPVQ
jgi:hypothetical protein